MPRCHPSFGFLRRLCFNWRRSRLHQDPWSHVDGLRNLEMRRLLLRSRMETISRWRQMCSSTIPLFISQLDRQATYRRSTPPQSRFTIEGVLSRTPPYFSTFSHIFASSTCTFVFPYFLSLFSLLFLTHIPHNLVTLTLS